MRLDASARAMSANGHGAAARPARGGGLRLLERPTGGMRVVYEVVRVLLIAAALAGAAQPFMHQAGFPDPLDVTLR
ncbi:MAG: hypothetical protein KIT14_05550 [bacterium]|nr:hypothetical protein [bacterium]